MNTSKILLPLISLGLIVAASAHAVPDSDPPPLPPPPPARPVLWRIDVRTPDDVFAHGFSPRGTNRDFMQHVAGHSCRPNTSDQEASAFIPLIGSSTSLFNVARDARHHLQGTFWVYEVARSRHLDYNVLGTLTRQDIRPTMNQRYSARTMEFHVSMARWTNEWISINRISPQRIVSATPYRFDANGKPERDGDVQNNPGFADFYDSGMTTEDGGYLRSRYLSWRDPQAVKVMFWTRSDSDVPLCLSPCSGSTCDAERKVHPWTIVALDVLD